MCVHWSRPLICRSPPNRLSSFLFLEGPACRDLGFSRSQLPRCKVSQSYRQYANQQRRIIKYNQNKICCAIVLSANIKSTRSIAAALDVPYNRALYKYICGEGDNSQSRRLRQQTNDDQI